MRTCKISSRLIAATVLATVAAGCTAPAPSAPPFPEGTPRLVLFLVVDQLSPDYLLRFRPLLEGGLAYLLEQGVVFEDAHHEHANTVTGAGHATLSSGCFPRRSGIVANQWLDRASGDEVYCVQGRDYRRSPANLLVTTLADWIKQRDSASRVFSASQKDRSAVLMGGHEADAALWYGGGDWVTTGYYTAPSWLDDFNEARWLDQYFGSTWEPLPVPQETLDALGIVAVDEGVYQRAFPYAFGSKTLSPDSAFYGGVLSSPMSDGYLAHLAEQIIDRESLGADDHPDFLALGFSALDYVGHGFGPDSREVLDTVMRLDRTLGELLDFVDTRVGLENTVISLSSDHGVAPMPSLRRARELSGDRADAADVACFQDVGRQLIERFGDDEWLLADLYLNEPAMAAAGIDRDELEDTVARLLEGCDAVERVWTRSELMAAPAPEATAEEERFHRLFANSYHPDRSPDFEIQYRPYYVDRRSAGTTHGSPHAYDTWVPLIIAAPGIDARQETGQVATADLAPTLAGLLGLAPPAELDGVDRSAQIRR